MTDNYLAVLDLAKSKGYDAAIATSVYSKIKRGAFSGSTTKFALVELTLIQAWLRDKGIYVFEDRAVNMRWYSQKYKFLISVEEGGKGSAICVARATAVLLCFDTYEEALCDGIFEALKLIQ